MVAIDDGDRAHLIVVSVCERVVSIDMASLTCHVAGCMLVRRLRWHGHVVVVMVGGREQLVTVMGAGGCWQR